MIVDIQGFSDIKNKNYKDFLNLRRKIYVDDLKYDKFHEFDGLDSKSNYYLIKYSDKFIGVLRYTSKENDVIIDRFGILKEFRKKALGSLLLRFVIDELSLSKKKIFIISSEDKLAYFKIFGFKKTEKEAKIGTKKLHLLQIQ